MQLVLTPPPGWVVEADATRAALPAHPGVVFEWSGLLPLPTRADLFDADALAASLPAGGRLHEIRRVADETETGWPVLVVEAMVVVAERVVELRLAAVYGFRELAARALLRAADEATYFSVRDEVRAAMVAARPDFRGGVTSIADFWGDDSR